MQIFTCKTPSVRHRFTAQPYFILFCCFESFHYHVILYHPILMHFFLELPGHEESYLPEYHTVKVDTKFHTCYHLTKQAYPIEFSKGLLCRICLFLFMVYSIISSTIGLHLFFVFAANNTREGTTPTSYILPC